MKKGLHKLSQALECSWYSVTLVFKDTVLDGYGNDFILQFLEIIWLSLVLPKTSLKSSSSGTKNCYSMSCKVLRKYSKQGQRDLRI